MSELKGCAVDGLPPATSALVLCGESITPEERDLTRLLDFFAIPWKAAKARGGVEEFQGKYAIVASADCMVEAMLDARGLPETLPPWITKASSVYIYGFQESERSTNLLRFLTGDPQATVRPIHTSETNVTVTADYPEMCGPMSGMRVPVTLRARGCVCDVRSSVGACQSIVRADEGEVFFGITCAGVRFCLNAWGGTLDIGALSPEYFDVKRFFCEAVPPVFFLKWAFRDATPSPRETSACLIVDDPPLKRRYGFLDFREALELMDRHNFTTTVAFIPWNWRRTHPGTLSMFQSRPERLSLVVHGCDHTAGEFAERSPALLNRKIQTSRQRMECFRRRASIEAGHLMVFPQGRFSPETGRALKLNGFTAAVNTEVAPAQQAANETTIADLWSVAIMRYGTFPIFTRRYPDHGIENFAFDAILGKPCLIAAHHDVFRDHARNLVDLIARLNSLRWNLVWRPLGEAVSHSFTTRRFGDGTRVIQMFAGRLVVENPDADPWEMLLLKEEGDPDSVQAVLVNEEPVEFSIEDAHLRVRLIIPSRTMAVVRLEYRNTPEPSETRPTYRARLRVAARRYLSEFKDNYLSRNDHLYQSAKKLTRLMK